MKNLSEIKDQIVDFWDLKEDSERDNLVKQIRQYSNSVDEHVFIEEVRNTFEQKVFSGIGVIYEALSQKPEKWGLFFKEEYQRAFEKAGKSNEPVDILDCLEEIGYVEERGWSGLDEIINILHSYISNPNDVLRFKSIEHLHEWLTEENIADYPHIVSGLKDKLKDQNWKIRFAAKDVLEDLNRLPKGYKMSFADKMKAKIISPYSI